MNRQLPDVNVLFALLWPRHEFYPAAQSWFADSGRRAWASNAVTQIGALRLLTNPALTQGAVSPEHALTVLTELTAQKGHEFWPSGQDTVSALKPLASRLHGHRQWTDALLLAHAIEQHGVLVSFDAGIKELVRGELASHLLILKRR